jgi:acetyl-CoA synthetase
MIDPTPDSGDGRFGLARTISDAEDNGGEIVDANELILARVRDWLDAYDRPAVAVADLLCDRHATDGTRLALRYEDASRRATRLTFFELLDRSARFAGVLRDLGVGKGDRVATLLPKTPELLIAVLGIWRLGAVHVPLFTAFGPQAIAYRIAHSETRIVVTDAGNRAKLESNEPSVLTVITVEDVAGKGSVTGDLPFWQTIETASAVTEPTSIAGGDPFILIYTSGTTGQPKGVAVPVKALAEIHTYMHFGLDLRPDDVFWNAADPGWAYGLYYAVVGPLLLGQPTLFVNAPFDAERTDHIWRKYGVTNFAAAPTIYRALRAAGVTKQSQDELRLRVASSAGEPLNPEVIAWAAEDLGVPLHDQYGQTEHGMIANNHHHPALRRPPRPGSMGQAMPGFRIVVVDSETNELAPGEEGQLAIDITESPSFWFGGYYRDPAASARCFSGDGRYYLAGDAVRQDVDGFVTFTGRADDLINSAGYRIGPFEVESALVGHRAVVEAAVIGKPDQLRGELVKAFVVLKPGTAPSDELADELARFVKTHLSAHAYPREVEFVDQLPKTPSGKIQRFVLRARELERVPAAL